MRTNAVITVSLLTLLVAPPLWAADKPNNCRLACDERLVDKLEAFAMVGFGARPVCTEVNCCIKFRIPQIKIVKPNSTQPIWSRIVYFDRLGVGIPNREVELEVMEVDGRKPTDPSQVQVTPNRVRTSTLGFSEIDVSVSIGGDTNIGRLLVIRSQYADAGSASASYGPYLYVTKSETLRSAERDFLHLNKLPLPGRCN